MQFRNKHTKDVISARGPNAVYYDGHPSWERVEDPLFDPSKHDVDSVLEHLKTADDAERSRVLEVEKAGKARVTIVGQPEQD